MKSIFHSAKILFPAVLAAGFLCLNGCTTVPMVRSARSLSQGQSESDFCLQAYSIKYTNNSASIGLNFPYGVFRWENHYGTDIPGLEAGFGIDTDLEGSVDVKYQWLGFKKRSSFSSALDVEGQLSFMGIYGINGALLFTLAVGSDNFTFGGRMGVATSSSFWGSDVTLNDLYPDNHGYADLFAGYEFPLSGTVSLDLGFNSRFLLDQSFMNSEGVNVQPLLTGMVGIAFTNLGEMEKKAEIAKSAAESLKLGRMLCKQGMYKDAIEELKKAGTDDTSRAEADYLIGRSYYGLHAWELSQYYLEKAAPAYGKNEKFKKMLEEVKDKAKQK